MGDAPIVDLTSLGSEEDHPRPLDETENQARNKKYHQDNGSFSGSQSRIPREEDWMRDSPKRQEQVNTRMSYRDSVRNPARYLEFNKEGDEDGDEPEDDGNVGFKFLLRKVNRLWGRTGEVELVDLGKVLRIDANTTHQIRGQFSRLCVELDLSKPLLSQYCVHGNLKKIEYEGLHLICFECGVYGHDLEHCPVRRVRQEKEKQEKEKEGHGSTEINRNNTVYKNSPYGAWMTVVKPSRPRRPRQNAQSQAKVKSNEKIDQGSGFAILGDEEQEILSKAQSKFEFKAPQK
ncbi:ribonuclease H [Senna tora]|uniref:Ribonuclease H n=1 Tax=Senna tora TaxID=362788 RepID=A0A835CKJ0_9FABA|nr:ribonuclease H [Senna tora]